MSMTPNTPHDVTLTAYTGDGTSEVLTGYSGLFELPDLAQGGFEVVNVTNRGEHVALLRGADRTYDLSFEFTVGDVDDLTDASAHRMLDMINQTGLYASGYTSVETIGCGVWAVKLVLTVMNGCSKGFTLTMDKCRARATLSMTEEGTRCTVNVTCYTLPVIS